MVLLNYGAEVALSSGRAWTDEPTASKRCAGSWDESVAVFLEGYGKMLEEIRKFKEGEFDTVFCMGVLFSDG